MSVGQTGRVDTVTLPDGSVLSYQYSGPSPNFALTKVTYPDSSFKSFLYNESGFSSAPAITIALTGAVDENNVRTGTYKYDSSGKAYSTEAADGVNKYTMTYGGSYTYVTSPLNAEYLTYFTTVDGVMAVSSRNQPAGSGCSASRFFNSMIAAFFSPLATYSRACCSCFSTGCLPHPGRVAAIIRLSNRAEGQLFVFMQHPIKNLIRPAALAAPAYFKP